MDVESVDRVLRTTRSVRRRLDFERPVEPEVIEACIDLATQAPTGLDRENWRFLVVTDPEKKRALADLYRTAFDGMVSGECSAPTGWDTGTGDPGSGVSQI